MTLDLWFNEPHLTDARYVRGLVASKKVSDILVTDYAVSIGWSQVLTAAGLRPGPHVGGVTIFHVPAAWLAPRGA